MNGEFKVSKRKGAGGTMHRGSWGVPPERDPTGEKTRGLGACVSNAWAKEISQEREGGKKNYLRNGIRTGGSQEKS